jgi:hypothetical protein
MQEKKVYNNLNGVTYCFDVPMTEDVFLNQYLVVVKHLRPIILFSRQTALETN